MLSQLEVNTVFLAGSFLITVMGTIWALRNWFASQFAIIFDRLDSSRKEILDKLEYHERHDDRRFSRLGEDLWALRLRLVANSGGLTEENIRKANVRDGGDSDTYSLTRTTTNYSQQDEK